jgi:methylated-DNA-[protein]-cysteine S-methyltransferase
MDFIHQYASPLGMVTVASDGRHIVGLWFKGQKYFASTLKPHAKMQSLPIFNKVDHWLDQYFRGKIPHGTPPLLLRTSAFQQQVAQIMQQIPYGKVMTYGEIAKLLARKMNLKSMSAQAVGQAVAHNPISLIIPCHRVVGGRGELTGYAAGIKIKSRLIDFESKNHHGQF